MYSDPNEELAVCDLWAAEAYLTALDAGEAKMLEMLNSGVKIHNWCWDTIKKMFPAHLPDSPKSAEGFNYKSAKQFIHSLNYNVKEDRMSQESGLDINVCRWFYTYYHSTFPGIQLRQARIRGIVQEHRCITSPLGRRRFYFAPFGVEVLNSAFAWPSQSCIGEIANKAMTRLHLWGRHGNPWIRPCLNTHDGIGMRILRGNRDTVEARVRDAFNIPVTLRGLTVVIPVELQFGDNFNDLGDTRLIKYAEAS